MTDYDVETNALLETLAKELDDLNWTHASILEQAKAKSVEAQILAVRIQGIKEGYDRGLAAATSETEVPEARYLHPARLKAAGMVSELQPEKPRQPRRNIRELVLTELETRAPLGLRMDQLVSQLDAAKTSVENALAYHEAKGTIRQNEAGGVWFIPYPAQSNGESSPLQAMPPSPSIEEYWTPAEND